jgi:hypothetical protein
MKKGSFSKITIWTIIVLNILFAAAVLYVFYKTGSEPTVLIGFWFGFTSGEITLAAWIKRNKLKKGAE